jgi:hypothetical protein
MRTRHALVVISAAQLAAGVAGQLVAVRDRRSFDIALIGWRGRPNRVAHDTWLLGTGLSAPVTILATQASPRRASAADRAAVPHARSAFWA